VCLSLLACGSLSGGDASPPPSPDAEDARRLAAILDYVAGDYGGAVRGGAVIDAGEYAEQQGFLVDARALAGRLGAETGVAEVAALVEGKAEPERVAAAARGLRAQVLAAHHVVLAPTSPPSRARGQELYGQLCASCHGAHGGGDGDAGKLLKPPPRNFRDPEVMAGLSPVRAFNALTDGLKGTAMVSFGQLSPADRWALAYTVFTLRHDGAAEERGQAALAQAGPEVPRNATALAGVTDGQLAATLGPDAIAALRGVTAFAASHEPPLAEARHRLAAGIALYRQGDAGARQAIGAAYLDGFEPHEGALRARDAALVTTCEDHFLRIRDAIGAGAPLASVEKEALQLDALLERADQVLGAGGGPAVAFVSAIVVILREGVEAALLLMLLLGMARRQSEPGAADRDAMAVHAGWLAAAGLGVVTWFASEAVVGFAGASRELLEGVVSLLAAAILLLTGHFVIARIDARQRVDAMKRRLAAVGASGRRRAVLASLAFIAVYREAFEVVLFLRAIALDADGAGGAVGAGAAAGGLLLVGVVWLLLRLGRRLKPGPLLAVMGTLLCVLAVVLAGKGVRALQEAGWIGIHPIDLPSVDWLGVFPSAQGLVAQALVLGAFAAIAFTALRERRAAV
jgi:high-affinity iron transporter